MLLSLLSLYIFVKSCQCPGTKFTFLIVLGLFCKLCQGPRVVPPRADLTAPHVVPPRVPVPVGSKSKTLPRPDSVLTLAQLTIMAQGSAKQNAAYQAAVLAIQKAKTEIL